MNMTAFEKEAFELIEKARSTEDLYIDIEGSLSENTKAIMEAYGFFGSKSVDVRCNDLFYKLTTDGILLLEKRYDRISTKKRANVALIISIIAVIVSVIAILTKV